MIIQSFKPGEVTPEQCNALGLELAEKIAPDHQVAIYTHSDTDHVHNHIVINAINLETGKNSIIINKHLKTSDKQMMRSAVIMVYLFPTIKQKCATPKLNKIS